MSYSEPGGNTTELQASAVAAGSQVPEPNVAWTVVATVLFGVLGVIAAAWQANKATQLGLKPNKYWIAFAISLAVAFALEIGVVLLFFVLIWTASGSSSPDLSWLWTLLMYVLVAAAAVGFGALADLPEDRRRRDLLKGTTT
jgi:peptidoglycan/LPS O-acetylase OafA/YrhL